MKDFAELEKPFSILEASAEASRCLSCKNPRCQINGCPLQMNIPAFIKCIKNNDIKEAYAIISLSSLMPSICSRVCNFESQCVGSCILNFKNSPINIPKLERYVAQNHKDKPLKNRLSQVKVAIIGSGPSGLSCAKKLLLNGISVDIYEKEAFIGGLLSYGIPNYRLPIEVLNEFIDQIKDLGGNFILQSDLPFKTIKQKYDYTFIGTGLNKTKELGIINEDNPGVFNALDLLKDINYFIKYRYGKLPCIMGNCLVIGCGNVAIDIARCLKRITNFEVRIVYRRSRLEAPASEKEIKEAMEEGIIFSFLLSPVEIITQGEIINSLKCEVMTLKEEKGSERKVPVGTGEFVNIMGRHVIKATGTEPDEYLSNTGIELEKGYIKTTDKVFTSIQNVFAGGDIKQGASTVIKSCIDGSLAALEIIKQIKGDQ